MRIFEVGGCVRDSFMGRRSHDVDYTVEAESFDAMRAGVIARGGQIFVESPQFNTIRARIGRDTFDFVLARRDGEYTDGRRPDSVIAGTLFDDLARRDFTINAIARAEDGTIIDPHDGVADIERKLIRCVGDPDARFKEDGLRILRAIRFGITLGFEVDEETFNAAQRNKEMINSVSVERVREEIEKCFIANTVLTMQVLIEWEIAEIVFSRGLRASATMKS